MAGIRKSFRRQRWNSLRDNNRLSESEVKAEDIHTILVSLKSGVNKLKNLHRSWQYDKKKDSVDQDYKREATGVIRRCEELCKKLNLEPKGRINELAREKEGLEYRITTLEKQLEEEKAKKEKLFKKIPKDLVNEELHYLREENMSLKRKLKDLSDEEDDDGKRPKQEFTRQAGRRQRGSKSSTSEDNLDGRRNERTPYSRDDRQHQRREESPHRRQLIQAEESSEHKLDGRRNERTPYSRDDRQHQRREVSPHRRQLIQAEESVQVRSQDNTFAKEISQLKETQRQLQDTVETLKVENNALSESNRKLTRDLNVYKGQEETLKQTNHNLHETLREEKAGNETRLARVNETVNVLEQSIERKQKELEKEQARSNGYRLSEEQLKTTIDKLNELVHQERRAKENALTRLSAIAGSKIRDNNPGITDLSDPNRPMKLAEKISELYDNEWTNCMENLEENLNKKEEEGIKILLNILSKIFEICQEMGNEQRHQINNLGFFITMPSTKDVDIDESGADIKSKFPQLPIEITKPLKDYKKQHCERAVPLLYPIMKRKLTETFTDDILNECDEFIQSSVKYTWIMCMQDPPVFIDWNYSHGDEFDANKLRTYTKGGSKVNYMVWPVLYLHKGGPLLAKGVAQGLK